MIVAHTTGTSAGGTQAYFKVAAAPCYSAGEFMLNVSPDRSAAQTGQRSSPTRQSAAVAGRNGMGSTPSMTNKNGFNMTHCQQQHLQLSAQRHRVTETAASH